MCGICGKLDFATDGRVGEALIQAMCDTISHRGPDEHGVYVRGRVGLGHRRLSIIDLSTGQQPMSNERRDLWIVFNGEIYNFQELRQDLERRGYRFHSTSDTEVIVHLYDEYGPACVRHLRGMFAFALWDQRRQRLVLARDRLGQKPLFYALTEQALVFASEIKAILQDAVLPREMNLTAMYHFLTYQYVPPPDTMFQGISELPPAHTLICENGAVWIERYWNLSYLPKYELGEGEILERAEHLIQEAVKLRLISDVPLGAFLSGGIDSSLVVAYMAQFSDRPVKTFSIGFEEKVFNELPYARMVAERYATEHHEFIVKPNALEILPKLIWHFDQPFGDSSAIPTFYLSEMTSRHVKVALNGDGGDESFAGYWRYLGYAPVRYYRILPQPLRSAILRPAIDRLAGSPVARQWMPKTIRRAKFLSDLSFKPQEDLYARMLEIFDQEQKIDLLSADLRRQFADLNSLTYMFRYFHSDQVDNLIDRMLYSDVMTYLPGDLLVKVDRATMAYGLEGRSPFLDHHVMEFAARLPADNKLRGSCLKYLLKKLGGHWLPPPIIRRRKQGFGVPLGQWFQHELRAMLHDILEASRLAADGVLDGATIRRLLQEHEHGTRNHYHRIWVILNLELWYRSCIMHTS